MAAFPPDCPRRRRAPQWACVLALALGALHALPAMGQQQEILLDAESSDFDRRNERLVFREVRIQQGETVVSARHAETRDLDFSRGSWLFEGDVRISSPVGVIESERATIRFADHRLLQATAEGAPARFFRTITEPEPRRVSGTANRIDYDLGRGELELAGQAALRDGVREVSGGRLIYRIAEDRLLASTDEEGTDRVRIVITPPAEDDGPREPTDGDEGPETP